MALLGLLAVLNYWAGKHGYVYWGGAAIVFLVIALAMPRILAPLKRLWLWLGHVFHRVVGPPVLALTYVVAIVPVGLLVQVFGLDLLAMRRNKNSAASYWRSRAGGPAPESLRDQF